MMNTYLAKQLQSQMAVKQKSKEVIMKNIHKEAIPRLLKEHGQHTDNAKHISAGMNAKKEYLKDYTRQNVKWNILQRYLK